MTTKPKPAKALKPKAPHILDPAHPLVALVLAAIKNSKAQRETVEAGEYHVDAIVRVIADVTVGEDVPAEQVNKIEPWTIIALLLDKLPAVKIEDVVAEASALLQIKEQETDLEDRAELMKERAQFVLDTVKPAAVEAVEAMKAATKEMKKGAVKLVDPRIEIVEQDVETIE